MTISIHVFYFVAFQIIINYPVLEYFNNKSFVVAFCKDVKRNCGGSICKEKSVRGVVKDLKKSHLK